MKTKSSCRRAESVKDRGRRNYGECNRFSAVTTQLSECLLSKEKRVLQLRHFVNRIVLQSISAYKTIRGLEAQGVNQGVARASLVSGGAESL